MQNIYLPIYIFIKYCNDDFIKFAYELANNSKNVNNKSFFNLNSIILLIKEYCVNKLLRNLCCTNFPIK
jgi:hypothetical protein